jgi:hypothetical protein
MPDVCARTPTTGLPIDPKNDARSPDFGGRMIVWVVVMAQVQIGKKLWSWLSSMTALTWALGSTMQNLT